jgi:exopolysaccharide biosynthesis polyprenyl glycosylphosphotransferase
MYITRAKKYYPYLFVLDVLSVLISGILSCLVTSQEVGIKEVYSPMLIYYCSSVVMSAIMLRTYHNFLTRPFIREINNIIKQYLLTAVLMFIYIFPTKQSFSKKIVLLIFFFSIVLNFVFRIITKKIIQVYYSKVKHGSNCLIAVTKERAAETVEFFKNNEELDYNLMGVVIVDAGNDVVGKEICGIKVVANMDSIVEYSKGAPVDAVYINIGYHNKKMKSVVEIFEKMGATVHVELNCFNFDIPNAKIEKICGNYVLTTSNNAISSWQAIAKRLLDIVGGLAGCIVTIVLCIFIVPAIKIVDRGPAFFSQVRVGRNGRKFKMYKFRSMYMDAEERKKELIKQNEMGSDMMFKIDDDPRILPKVGKFIRKTSLDEFPQFFNVLKGDMSLVGTRPPTEDEFVKYSLHHKSRLSFKPGITGLWQVSGRSEITDFEEIVRLDTSYIKDWSLTLDIKILCKTFTQIFKGDGAK